MTQGFLVLTTDPVLREPSHRYRWLAYCIDPSLGRAELDVRKQQACKMPAIADEVQCLIVDAKHIEAMNRDAVDPTRV